MSTDHKPFNGHTPVDEWNDAYDTVNLVKFNKDDAEFAHHAVSTYYTREAELSSLRESLKMCVEALDKGVFPNSLSADEVALLAMNNAGSQKSIDTARQIANDYRASQDAMRLALSHVKATHPNL